MDTKTYSLCECVYDITTVMDEFKFEVEDSRERARLAIIWAEEFDQQNADREWDGEYMEEIEAFAISKINAANGDIEAP